MGDWGQPSASVQGDDPDSLQDTSSSASGQPPQVRLASSPEDAGQEVLDTLPCLAPGPSSCPARQGCAHGLLGSLPCPAPSKTLHMLFTHLLPSCQGFLCMLDAYARASCMVPALFPCTS